MNLQENCWWKEFLYNIRASQNDYCFKDIDLRVVFPDIDDYEDVSEIQEYIAQVIEIYFNNDSNKICKWIEREDLNFYEKTYIKRINNISKRKEIMPIYVDENNYCHYTPIVQLNYNLKIEEDKPNFI